MQDYDRLSEEFRVRLVKSFTYEADIRAILNGFKFDEFMANEGEELSGGQNTRLCSGQDMEKPNLLVLD